MRSLVLVQTFAGLDGHMRAALLLDLDTFDFPIVACGIEESQSVCILFAWARDEQLLCLISELLLIEDALGRLLNHVGLILCSAFIDNLGNLGQINETGLMPSLVRDNILELVQQSEWLWCDFVKAQLAIWAIHQQFILVWINGDLHCEDGLLQFNLALADDFKVGSYVGVLCLHRLMLIDNVL